MKRFIKLFFISLICIFIYYIPSFADVIDSNPNAPILLDGMDPIKWDNGEKKESSYNDLGWYYYEKNKWANAVDGDGNYWVWIPRYTYKIVDGKVSIRWSVGTTDDTTDGYMAHPAFTLDSYMGGNNYKNESENNELTGFWMAKYLASDDNGELSITPGQHSDKNKTIGEAFDECINLKTGLGVSSHLVKASEWGAVAYLSDAFGKEPEENITKFTGGNAKYSTTHNMYGVFDMNGPTSEYLAGLVFENDVNSDVLANMGMILDDEYDRYVDIIDIEDSTRMLAFAIKNIDNAKLPNSSSPVLIRGGADEGVYGYSSSNGRGCAFRPVLAVYTSYLADNISFFDTEASVVEGDHLVLSVNFSADEKWRFDLANIPKPIIVGGVVDPDMATYLFKTREDEGKNKIIDLRYVLNNDYLTLEKTELNAHLVGIIEGPYIEDNEKKGNALVETLDKDTTFKANTQYTIRVRVGGYIDENEEKPVFNALLGMESKIIVENINVKSADNGAELKITRIPNNKVRLSIFNPEAKEPDFNVRLKVAPTQRDYNVGEPLSLPDGELEISCEGYPSYTMPVDIDNVVDKDITKNEPGEYKVELSYGGKPVIQDDVEYWICIKEAFEVKVEVKVEDELINKANIGGNGSYSAGEMVKLTAEADPGYKFDYWSTESNISISDTNSSKMSFIMPSENVEVTAHLFGLDDEEGLKVVDQKREFELGESFGLGENGKIIAKYKDGTSEILTLESPGVSVMPEDSDSLPEFPVLDRLGTFYVVIKYGDKEVTYDITVVNKKYDLTVEIKDEDENGNLCGSVKKDGNVVVPVDGKNTYIESIPHSTTFSLEAVPNEGYSFDGWDVDGYSLSEDDLTSASISLLMPEEDITIRPMFVKSYTIKYLVNDSTYGHGYTSGSPNYGYISGNTEQIVKHGGSTTKVEAIANDGYAFKNWSDGRTSADRIDQDVKANAEYTANFVKTWNVTYIVKGNIYATRVIPHGENGYIPLPYMGFEVPDPESFGGWDVDLRHVTRDIVATAKYVPRIKIVPKYDESVPVDSNGYPTEPQDDIKADITGTQIEVNTLEYIISESPTETGENISDYVSNDTFDFNGSWDTDLEDKELYRSYVALASKEDSSTTITINSKNDKELVKFDYMLHVGEAQMLGITVNGKRITEYDLPRDVWHGFNSEVKTIDGQIVIGISYSQDETYATTDYAAIRNLKVGRQWTKIPNEYYLNDSAIWTDNYVHIRGVGSDDGVMYQIVSNPFKGNSENTGDIYSINYELHGGTVDGENPTGYTVDTETFTLINPTKIGSTFLGWTGSCGTEPVTEVTIPKGSEGNKSYVANWISDGYLITVVQGANGTISPESHLVLGGNATFTMTPDTGYNVSNVIVDGNSQGVSTTYTFVNVDAEHTITATYSPVYYGIKYDLDGGSVFENPTSYTIEMNDITLINPTKIGYKFIGWTGSNGATPQMTVTIPKGSTGDRYYFANWEILKYKITVTQGSNGTISPSTTEVSYGSDCTFEIKPDSEYIVSDVLVDGVSVGAKTSYTFYDVTGTHTISATFKLANK